jgi:CRISPR-associated protein Cst2
MKRAVYSVGISGRMILDMHSLNNEGGEGNQIQTRMVTIVHPVNGEFKVATVNAISGDMLKHIQTEHFYRLAKGKLPLCKGCELYRSSRVLEDDEFMKSLPAQDSAAIDALLRRCALDDVAGNLVAAGNRSIPRKSVVEFGWVVGLPEVTRTESYFHVRYASERGGEEEAERQAIFHRPASSGVYAVVAGVEVSRIGFNDITQTFAVDDDQREQRYNVLLKSIMFSFIEPGGAMRGTQNPHILGFEGAVTVSYGVSPAPVMSPLRDGYLTETQAVVSSLNRVNGGVVEFQPFATLSEFAQIMERLVTETLPFKVG